MVIPNLPRELLWTDRNDFSDFLSEELCSEIVSNIFLTKSHITKKLGITTMLKLFNEAFYLSTRIVYEHDAESLPETYAKMIMDDLENQEWVEHVILIMFLVLTLQRDKSKEVLLFVDKLQKRYLPEIPFRIINIVNKVFKPWKKKMGYRLKPCPCPADILQNSPLDWRQITQNFSKHVIIGVLDLWDDDNEKGKVIRLIEQAYTSSYQNLAREDEQSDKVDDAFFTGQKNLYKVRDSDSSAYDNIGSPMNKLSTDNYFRHNNEYVRDLVRNIVQEFYLSEIVNLALIEIVFFTRDIITKRNSHKRLVLVLKNWGALPQELDANSAANGMSQKFHDLKDEPFDYSTWSEAHLNDRLKCIKIENKLQQLMSFD